MDAVKLRRGKAGGVSTANPMGTIDTAGLINIDQPIIEFITGLAIFFSGITLEEERIPVEERRNAEKGATIGIADGKALDAAHNQHSVETHVRTYFADEPTLIRVAWCETKFKHWDESGNVLRGEVTPKDVGVMQINEYYHGKTVGILGINIHTLEGNLGYARWLYEREGLTPWASSKHCWGDGELALLR